MFETVRGRVVMLCDLSPLEIGKLNEWVEEQSWRELAGPTYAFPSDQPNTAMVLFEAGMGCGTSRWDHDILPELEAMFPNRVVHTVEWNEEEYE